MGKKECLEMISRICPLCLQKREYRNTAYARYYVKKSDSQKTVCRSCSSRLQSEQNNPFKGKTHTDESKRKMSLSRKGKSQSGRLLASSRKSIIEAGKKARLKSCYGWWVDKYGKAEADNRMLNLKLIQSMNSTGEKIICLENHRLTGRVMVGKVFTKIKIFEVYVN